MAKVTPITERFQHFLREMKESFSCDLYDRTKQAWQQLFEAESERLRDLYSGRGAYQRSATPRRDYRNGYYERDFVTRFGTPRLRIARTRAKNFLPSGLDKFQRRAPELAPLIREAFLRGISTRQVGRVAATLTEETVSAQTVSNLIRDLDEAMRQFHQAQLQDEWAYLFLNGVSLRVRRPAGRQRVQMLVAYGVRRDGSCQLLAFLRTRGEGQADCEGLLQDLYRRELAGKDLQLIVTDGCAGLAAATQAVYPRMLHQRCWVHKMRNILEKVRKCDYDQVKADAQAIGRRASAGPGRYARFLSALAHGVSPHGAATASGFVGTTVLLPLFTISERCFVEVRRRTRCPWSVLSMCRAWIGSSTPSSGDLIWNGKTAPSGLLCYIFFR